MTKKDLIETPYGRKTPELLCKAMDALVLQPRLIEAEQQLAAKDALLRQASDAFYSISLCEFNSMSSRQEMGRLARDAVEAIDKGLGKK